MEYKQDLIKRPRHEAGFTMIELIMVIVVLGILAAALAPKFLDVAGEAETAMSEKAYGDIESTMATAFGMHRARRTTASNDPSNDDGQSTWIEDCADLISYLGDMGDITCAAGVVTFTDGDTAAITAELVDASASLGDKTTP